MSSKVKVFALSTCGWCKRAISWLDENGVTYEKIETDKLDSSERESVLEEMKQFNPRRSFPTIVIDDGAHVVIGFRPEELEGKLLK